MDGNSDDLQIRGETTGNSGQKILVTVYKNSTPRCLTFQSEHDLTFQNLVSKVESTFQISAASQRYFISPNPGRITGPFTDQQLNISLALLAGPKTKKITLLEPLPLLGETSQVILEAVSKSIVEGPKVNPNPALPFKYLDQKRAHDDAVYNFGRLGPLTYLPHPEKSLWFLERLRDDPGIRAAMRKWQWHVPLLTEMDPAAHTTHSYDGISRTLGLNRGAGQVIELRLRTDVNDGYRDYKTIRRTLCHELAHNVWGEHDQQFWKLCKDIEKVVERGDWKNRGHRLGGSNFQDDEHWEPPGFDEAEHRQRFWPDEKMEIEAAEREIRRKLVAQAADRRLKEQAKQQSPQKPT